MTTKERLLNLTPREEMRWPVSLWRASGLNNCKRLQLLEAKGIKFGLTPDIDRKYAMRSAIHEEMQKWLVKEFAEVKVEPKDPNPDVRLEHEYIDNEYRISGHPDAIILTTEPKMVVEIKTAASGPFKGYIYGRAKPYWGLQTDFYLKQAQEEFGSAEIVTLLVNVESAELAVIDIEMQDYKEVCLDLNFYWDTGHILTDAYQPNVLQRTSGQRMLLAQFHIHGRGCIEDSDSTSHLSGGS
jgi:hypothetical protein